MTETQQKTEPKISTRFRKTVTGGSFINNHLVQSLLASILATTCSLAAAAEPDGWLPWQPKNNLSPGAIGMQDWLERPAGARGGVRLVGDHFQLADGTPIRFWGVNLCSVDCLPAPADGAAWAERMAKYGVNAVRLHKFIGDLGTGKASNDYDPGRLANFDAFCKNLADRGIYYGLSWVFTHSVLPGDAAVLKHYDELKADGGNTRRVPLYICEDVQDLRIDMLVRLLRRVNPSTGKPFAKDPALSFIEIVNEDSIFWPSFKSFDTLGRLPSYKKAFLQRFSTWLQQQYGDHAGLVSAWGQRAINAFEVKDERLESGNIMVKGNPSLFSPEGLAQAEVNGTRQRLLDTARFLHHVQETFYQRFTKAVRDTGYEGPMLGSNWTSPAGLPNYYNLHNDHEVGIIDRHTYFGGYEGWEPRPGKFDASSQLGRPGSGLLSTGLSQTIDRPFALSEWNTVFPNAYGLESPTIIAAYGLGLQGWDASYHFASSVKRGGAFSTVWGKKALENRELLWNADVPNQIGLYPVLARMVYRGDVLPADTLGVRRVSLGELATGKPDWLAQETVSATPPEALAVGRLVVEFNDTPKASTLPNLKPYREGQMLRSSTGQLRWTADGQKGWIAIDTAGTQAVVGFVPAAKQRLGQVAITSRTPFAGIYLTSLAKDRDLAGCDTALLTAMARIRNTGMTYNGAGDELLTVGDSPILIEPVQAEVVFTRAPLTVELLDHDGLPTGKTLPVVNGHVAIDTGRDRTWQYLVRFRKR